MRFQLASFGIKWKILRSYNSAEWLESQKIHVSEEMSKICTLPALPKCACCSIKLEVQQEHCSSRLGQAARTALTACPSRQAKNWFGAPPRLFTERQKHALADCPSQQEHALATCPNRWENALTAHPSWQENALAAHRCWWEQAIYYINYQYWPSSCWQGQAARTFSCWLGQVAIAFSRHLLHLYRAKGALW